MGKREPIGTLYTWIHGALFTDEYDKNMIGFHRQGMKPVSQDMATV
jgi:hypothetical protein